MERVSAALIQKCQQGDKEYSKNWFIKLLTDNITQEEFDRFCREVLYLNHNYDSTCGLYATDLVHVFYKNEEEMFQLEEIDFDQPVPFKKIK